MSNLPDLPKGFQILSSLQSGTDTVYTAEQMREYARAAIRNSLHDDAGGKAVAWAVRDHSDGSLWGFTTKRADAEKNAEHCDDSTVALYTHPAPEPSLSREGASVSNAVRDELAAMTELRDGWARAAERAKAQGDAMLADLQAARGLVAKWRNNAWRLEGNSAWNSPNGAGDASRKNTLKDCADELERALATPNPATLAETAESVPASTKKRVDKLRETATPTERTPQRGGECGEYQAMRAAWDKVGNRKWHEQECSPGPASEWFELGWEAARKFNDAALSASAARSGGDAEKFPAPQTYGEQCPVGMVQIEFVGCSPAARMNRYGWAPQESAFLEVWVDGQRYRIDVGTFESREKRRGLHIIGPCDMVVDKHSLNALDVYRPAALQPNTTGEG